MVSPGAAPDHAPRSIPIVGKRPIDSDKVRPHIGAGLMGLLIDSATLGGVRWRRILCSPSLCPTLIFTLRPWV